jgi:phospholipid/cholesterol/gamma-HCH transport system substrate-binding protein
VALAAVAVASWLGYPRLFSHGIELKVYFQNANGLRAGAPVRLAGVEVGKVTSVRARPEMQAAPAEVTMKLQTPYRLNIPNDSTVSLDTAGVLGETYAEINVLGASGASVKNGEVLKEKPTKSLSTEEVIEKMGDIVQRLKPCAPQGKDTATAPTPASERKH